MLITHSIKKTCTTSPQKITSGTTENKHNNLDNAPKPHAAEYPFKALEATPVAWNILEPGLRTNII